MGAGNSWICGAHAKTTSCLHFTRWQGGLQPLLPAQYIQIGPTRYITVFDVFVLIYQGPFCCMFSKKFTCIFQVQQVVHVLGRSRTYGILKVLPVRSKTHLPCLKPTRKIWVPQGSGHPKSSDYHKFIYTLKYLPIFEWKEHERNHNNNKTWPGIAELQAFVHGSKNGQQKQMGVNRDRYMWKNVPEDNTVGSERFFFNTFASGHEEYMHMGSKFMTQMATCIFEFANHIALIVSLMSHTSWTQIGKCQF